MTNSTDFDPYRKWLGIPATEQPPTHYRLLAIGEFEDDPDVISNAADRCMAHVRTFQSGAHAASSQKILNELAAARMCLLSPQAKLGYDQQLRAARKKTPVRMGESAAAPVSPATPVVRAVAPVANAIPSGSPLVPEAMPVAQPVIPQAQAAVAIPVVGQPVAPEEPVPSLRTGPVAVGVSSARRRPRKKSSPIPLLIGATVVLGGIVAAVVAMRSGSKPVAGPATAGRATASPAPSSQSQRLPDSVGSISNPRRENTGGQPGLDIPPGDEEASDFDFSGPMQHSKRLSHIRSLIKSGRLDNARPKLDEVAAKDLPAEQAEQVAHLRKLMEYCDEIDSRLEKAWPQFAPGAALALALADGSLDSTARVLERDGDTMRVQHGGVERTLNKSKVPAPWTVALLRPQLEADPARLRLLEIVCHLCRREGDLERARQLLADAQNDGTADPAIAAELGGFVGDDTVSTDPDNDDGDDNDAPAENAPDDAPPKTAPASATAGSTPPGDLADEAPSAKPLGGRRALPAESDRRTAAKQLETQYGAQRREAITPAQKDDLANELYSLAEKSADDAPRQLAALEAVVTLRVEQGDALAMVGAIDRLGESFEIDALEWKSRYLTELAGGNQDLEQNEAIFSVASNLILEAKSTGHDDRLAPLAIVARQAALRTNNWRAVRDMQKLAAQHGAKH